MNKKALIVVGLIVTLIGAGLAYLLVFPQDSTNKGTVVSDPAATQTSQCENCDQKSGAYVPYSADVISQTSGTKILFFHAPWCPQCRELEASIQAGTIPSGVTIIKVDYDSSQGLRQKYGVTIQTTLVRVSDNGELEKKFVAYSEPTLDAVIKNLL